MTPILRRAVNEHGEVLDVLLQKERDTGAAKRLFRRLLDQQELPERVVADGLRSYGAAIREIPELGATERVTVSAMKRQNNLVEQSHRPTRDQERQQRGFKGLGRTQSFLFTHAEISGLFRHTRARTPASSRRRNLTRGFIVWGELSFAIL